MSRKDYEAIARILSEYGGARKPLNLRRALAYDLADHFARENERFDRARFLAAAGVDAE